MLLEEEMLAARRRLERPRQRRGLEPEIKEASSSHLNLLAAVAHVELAEDISRELARVQFPGLGQRHQRIGLVVAELGIRARPDQNRGNIGIGQNGAHGSLQALFDEQVWEHRANSVKRVKGLKR